MTHMDDNTNLTPEQTDMQNGAEVSFTITGEDAEARGRNGQSCLWCPISIPQAAVVCNRTAGVQI